MAHVAVIGLDPDLIDFSDPSIPPGLDADGLRDRMAQALAALRSDGHRAREILTPADPAHIGLFAERLGEDRVDCVVLAAGTALSPSGLLLLEAVLNAVSRSPSRPTIALVAGLHEVSSAVARQLARN